jgi:glycosyltransferase involved in cell wall biosynthesis
LNQSTILIVAGYYLPGFKAGGPTRTISNLVAWLGDEYEFRIVARDRDLGDTARFSGIELNTWQAVGKAQVKYLSPDQMTLRAWARLLRQTECDVVYLNSFFLYETRATLFLRRAGIVPRRPVILAPRGQFSRGALGLKSFKKRVYLGTVMRLGFYDHLTWHATSEPEIEDMQRALAPYIPDISSRIVLAPNLAAPLPETSELPQRPPKQAGSARVVFLSRVARMKNLHFALSSLQGLEQPVVFDIFGPKEDERYWEECALLIETMPPNVRVAYRGPVTPDQVPSVLSRYDLLFSPTLGENFGHTIVEAWGAGCPVLISDQTPWRRLEEKGIGWDLPLSDPDRFRDALQQVIAMDQRRHTALTDRARQFATHLIQQQSDADLPAYRRLFRCAMESGRASGRVAEQRHRS